MIEQQFKTPISRILSFLPGATTKMKLALLVPILVSIIIAFYRYTSAISGLRVAMAVQMTRDAYSGRSATALANGGMAYYEGAYENALRTELYYSIGIVVVGLAISFFMWYHGSVSSAASKNSN